MRNELTNNQRALDQAAPSLLLEAHSAAAATADADGQYPFQLLPSGASDDAATLLFKASGKPPRPLWEALESAATIKLWSAELSAALEADPGAAARPFATPAGWKPVEGAHVRLRPGLGAKNGLRAGELATVTWVDVDDRDSKLQRNGKGRRG